MIVVAGDLRSGTGAGVTAAEVAIRVAAGGGSVQAVGVLPADPAGDRAALALRNAGVGHAAVLRSAGSALEPADLDLALRYLPDVAAIVLVDPAAGLAEAAATAAGWSGAGLVVVTPPGGEVAGREAAGESGDLALPFDRTVVLAAPARDPDGAFAGVVAALAIRMAAGESAVDAWTETRLALGLEPVRPSSRS